MLVLFYWLVLFGVAGIGLVIGFWLLYFCGVIAVLVFTGIYSLGKNIYNGIRRYYWRYQLKEALTKFFENVILIEDDDKSEVGDNTETEEKPRARKISKTKK